MATTESGCVVSIAADSGEFLAASGRISRTNLRAAIAPPESRDLAAVLGSHIVVLRVRHSPIGSDIRETRVATAVRGSIECAAVESANVVLVGPRTPPNQRA